MKKKILNIFVVLVMLFVPLLSVNAQMHIENSDNLSSSKDVDGSALYTGNNVTFDKNNNGISFLAGNNITYTGTSDYAFVLGNVVKINGTIENDAFIFGNSLEFGNDSIIKRDTVIAAYQVVLSGKIERDVRIFASEVILKDVIVSGEIKIEAEKITVEDGASVLGVLKYNENAVTDISTNAQITKTETFEGLYLEPTFSKILINKVVSFASTLVLFAAIALVAPKLFKKVEEKTEKLGILNLFILFGYGAVVIMLVPILAAILFATVIGVPLAFLLLALYVMALLFASMFVSYLIGYKIWQQFIKKEPNVLLIGLIGLTIYTLITYIPYISGIIMFISIFVGIGLLFKMCLKEN